MDITPEDIESMSVLKGAAAAACMAPELPMVRNYNNQKKALKV
jgi:hypothetical protein